ncbi:phosphate propanoyltransferase [Sinanaerobacter sp. ZZT-01]|uniref:phosphate propanoyltransferase n=1 Tax=Sinanaerobacter sp. ZZT-01 TaxID=3111540 RepID=UPI002D786024|nr:phosphate propanoyltransferase [Sinanaerobacter sp. ZZT-01]WRR92077.1 phosphate propanoyltransferase [Sinanaerobacter sp. ZZT-01]
MDHNLVEMVATAMQQNGLIQVEVSARHVHLCQADLETLFGKGVQLTKKRDLSQPGQYLAEEKVTLVGSKGEKKVSVLGPVRKETQVELSMSDCMTMGIKAPVRLSGDLKDSGSAVLKGPCGEVSLQEGVIVAQAHVHMTPEAGEALGLCDHQKVKLELMTSRPTVLDAAVRISAESRCRVHIDTDEANASGCSGFVVAKIRK